MKLSAKKRTAIYQAIHEQLIQLRIEFQRRPEPLSPSDDFKIAQKVEPIFNDVLRVLEVES